MSDHELLLSEATARAIADMLVRHAAELNGLLVNLQGGLPHSEFDAARCMVGRVMGENHVAALHPLVEPHPHLKPPGFP